MPFKKGDFILVDYVGRVSETGEIFDTTIEDAAKNEGIYKEGGIYEPSLVVVGEGWVLKALDESLPNLELKKTDKIEIPPDKAFGNRDPEKIRLYPLRKLTSRRITPQVGMRVEVDGRLATVRTMGSGRVLLDFNPPLAGKTLVYEVTVQKKLTRVKERILALIHRRMPQVDISGFSLEIKANEVTVGVPDEAFYVEGLQITKRGVFIDIQKFFPKKKTIRFIETFRKPEPVEETPSSEEAPQSTEDSQ
ncbi:MAG: peptidylprolyl isomerase [Candidatus Bathyarchaeota archaeon]|nr:peptidylprolyl isomerase [Candidatus Bathyarchaeota archaeon]